MQSGMETLLAALDQAGFCVEVETNGSIPLANFRNLGENICFTMDYKLPSSGMEDRMCQPNLGHLRAGDAIKFVCGSREDLLRMWEILAMRTVDDAVDVFLSPAFGQLKAEEIAAFMKERELTQARLQLQLHKYVWPTETKGV